VGVKRKMAKVKVGDVVEFVLEPRPK